MTNEKAVEAKAITQSLLINSKFVNVEKPSNNAFSWKSRSGIEVPSSRGDVVRARSSSQSGSLVKESGINILP